MLNIQSGILDKTRLISNILMIALVAGNIFFSIQYTQSIADKYIIPAENTTVRYQASRVIKEFIEIVLNTKGTIPFEDRVKLENDIRQIHNADLTAQWTTFVDSKDAKTAQANAVKLMSMLANLTL
jgi:hypothetical protein